MLIKFTPTATMKVYRGTGADGAGCFEASVAGGYDWPQKKAEQVVADFPDNFALMSKPEPEPEEMVSPAPTNDRAKRATHNR